MRRAADLINNAQRPLILAGHGVPMSGAMEVLRAFAEKTDIPVALTLLGKGDFPESHPLALGMMGMHGEAFVNHAIQEIDLLLAFGMRFDDRVTGRLEHYAPKAHKIHVDLDAAELNKVVPVGRVIREAKGLARRIASKSALPIAAIIRAVNEGLEQDIEAAMDTERKQFINLQGSHDMDEGLKAFLEKRQPKFEDR